MRVSRVRLIAAAALVTVGLVPSLAGAGPLKPGSGVGDATECATGPALEAIEEQEQPDYDEDSALCVATGVARDAGKATDSVAATLRTGNQLAAKGLGKAGGCDPIDPAHCLLPFPNDYFTVADPTTATGRRVSFNPLAMPRNVAGKPVDPIELNKNDGFSPG